jgi:hypothetical protein
MSPCYPTQAYDKNQGSSILLANSKTNAINI